MPRTKRDFQRIKRRVNCAVRVGSKQHVGVVMNLSPGGFFVQTGAIVAIGARVAVALQGRSGETVQVDATVTNRREIPRRLATIARGGLGCKLTSPGESYYQLLAKIDPTRASV